LNDLSPSEIHALKKRKLRSWDLFVGGIRICT
jgi:hypothetical protein